MADEIKRNFLVRDEVRKISESVAEAVYATVHTRNTYESDNRLVALTLLRQCKSSHADRNRDCFVDAIHECMTDAVPRPGTTELVANHCRRLSRVLACRQARLSVKAKRDGIALKLDSRRECLANLRLVQERTTVFAASPDLIDLAYASANLRANRLLEAVVRRWDPLQDTVCLKHLCEDSDEILENFKFAVEKSVIKSCTDLLRGKEAPNLRRLLGAASRSRRLGSEIKNLLYALYTCSGCHPTLFDLVHHSRIKFERRRALEFGYFRFQVFGGLARETRVQVRRKLPDGLETPGAHVRRLLVAKLLPELLAEVLDVRRRVVLDLFHVCVVVGGAVVHLHLHIALELTMQIERGREPFVVVVLRDSFSEIFFHRNIYASIQIRTQCYQVCGVANLKWPLVAFNHS